VRDWRLLREDRGSTLLLTLGFVVIAVLLVLGVTAVSRVFLHDRALTALADGAAISAASAIDEAAVYEGRSPDLLPLATEHVAQRVTAYLDDAEATGRFQSLQLVEASTDGTTVTVRLSATVDLPFAVLLSDRYAAGFPVEVVARARAPYTG
jgi:Putative Flp pilus-assembly TadE/G-like